MFEANNLRNLADAYSGERAGLDPGGNTEDLVYDAALRVGEELAAVLALDIEAMVLALEVQ